ncbi:hypothetical protein R50345_12360 [Paenibacillus sp. FSL R5-0345]|uniref:DUF4179 domain-containing protein n=1 Tax=Paenibacillus sp. FSL R5-0345 TaxID=1536770 RepID=UPI0004F8E945|nr:DUF4179 domain-containing protein [Paenibacillus sp. FSL R5-0345]AIQ35331.1 hypothetical protein R50345_12360 [Paenibacillus sp. FSL R5-0345]
MAESEEKLLNDYFQRIDVEAEDIPEVKLDAAIRKGMQLGNRKRSSFRKRYTVVALAVLAIALLIIVPWANQMANPVRAQLPPKSWGQLEVFRPIIANNLTITSALDAGIMKEVNISSAEVDGIKWTVNGIIADRRGIALLYTIQNNTDQKMQLMGLSLKKNSEDNYDLTGYSGFSNSNAQEAGSPGTTRMLEQIVWNKYRDDLTDELNITLSLYPVSKDPSGSSSDIKKLIVNIPLEANNNYFKGEIIDLKESLSIAGQKIKMDNVYIGPTGIYMRENFDGDNTMRIFNMLSPKLVIGKGDHQEDLMWASGMNNYHNDNMRPDEPIKLEIEGISALDKSKVELVINTETQQILQAPDNNLTISNRMENEEQGILVLDYFIPKEDKEALGGSGFSLDDNFVDSAGSGHWLGRVKDGYSGYKEFNEGTKGTTITFFFNVGKEKLPQPLTFKFNSYSTVIKEKASLRIK